MLRLEELATLCKVVEYKSFSRAAEFLGLTQPAVSLQVKSLETEYNVELLHRNGFEILPTESGRAVYEFACQMVALYQKSKQCVHELGSRVAGKLMVGASTGPGEYLIPLILGRFKTQYPQVGVTLRVGDSSEIIDHIFKQQLEVGFVGTCRRERHLSFEPFIRDQLVLVASPDHPWANRSGIAPEELLQAPLILQQHGSGATEFLYEALHEYNINVSQLNVIMELGLQESTKAAVRAGFGVTMISKLGVVEELERKVLVEIPVNGIELHRDIYITYRRTSPLTNLARLFLDFACQASNKTTHQIKDGVFTAAYAF